MAVTSLTFLIQSPLPLCRQRTSFAIGNTACNYHARSMSICPFIGPNLQARPHSVPLKQMPAQQAIASPESLCSVAVGGSADLIGLPLKRKSSESGMTESRLCDFSSQRYQRGMHTDFPGHAQRSHGDLVAPGPVENRCEPAEQEDSDASESGPEQQPH